MYSGEKNVNTVVACAHNNGAGWGEMLADYFHNYLVSYRPYKLGDWCYEDGCVYRGLEMLHRCTGEQHWLDRLQQLVDAQLSTTGVPVGYSLQAYNIDDILSGRALLYLYETTGESRYMEAASTLAEQLETHPRTKAGVYWHKLKYPSQVWLDGLYMAAPFQIQYGQLNQQSHLVDDAMQQLSTALELTYVPTTGLYAHAFDEARNENWAHAETGRSSTHWGRSLGWLAMALVDVAGLVGKSAFHPLLAKASILLSDIAALRTSNGLWLQVIDQPHLLGNYEESSSSAMFTYALLKGRQLGIWDGDIDGQMERLVDGVLQRKNEQRVAMVNICGVAGLGMYQGRQRDGSAGYYLSEPCVSDDAKGVGALMMAYAISLKSEK